jgi:hypothetical protein
VVACVDYVKNFTTSLPIGNIEDETLFRSALKFNQLENPRFGSGILNYRQARAIYDRVMQVPEYRERYGKSLPLFTQPQLPPQERPQERAVCSLDVLSPRMLETIAMAGKTPELTEQEAKFFAEHPDMDADLAPYIDTRTRQEMPSFLDKPVQLTLF